MKPQARLILILLIPIAVSNHLFAALRLPAIFSDNMILQRDLPINVWGWADPGSEVTVTIGSNSSSAEVDADGKWLASLPELSVGPTVTLQVASGDETRQFNNILLGDVWICSGQSNMEWPLRNTNGAEAEIAKSQLSSIRLFTVEKKTSFIPLEDVNKTAWQLCGPESSGDFSAVAYYFGKRLNKALNIPIGLIHTSWGGTNIQTWMSWDLLSHDDQYKGLDLTALHDPNKNSEANREAYLEALENDIGLSEKWFSPKTNSVGWKPIEVPSRWSETEIGDVDGVVWYRIDFEIPARLATKEATLNLPPVDDADFTYLNGVLIGSDTAWDKPRSYKIPSNTLIAGKNSLVVKVIDNQGGGGIYGDPDLLHVDIDGTKIPLTTGWTYKKSAVTSDFGITYTGPNAYPSLLYNAMIHPLINFPIKGAIWYQGESNTSQAYKYRFLFKNLIKNWRAKWDLDFDFYWAQLANFMEASELPAESRWAELREAQDMALSLPKTGQAILIDIGEAGDIHPRNKLDVGQRLALAALYRTYDQDIEYSGPRYKSMKRKGNEIELTFYHTAEGLVGKGNKYGYLRGFAIAGEDKKFAWAQARVVGERIIVSSPDVKKPVAVRYAWGNNPDDANLYNSANLPAAPFRTDQWPGLTFEN